MYSGSMPGGDAGFPSPKSVRGIEPPQVSLVGLITKRVDLPMANIEKEKGRGFTGGAVRYSVGSWKWKVLVSLLPPRGRHRCQLTE